MMTASQRVLIAIRNHSLIIVVVSIFLAAGLTTRLSPLQELVGMDVLDGSGVQFSDLMEAAVYFPARMESDFNRHFTGREALVRANYRFRLNVLHEKDFHDVVVGKKGWLYYSGEKNLDYFQRATLMTPGQIEALLHQLSMINETLSGQGIAFYVVVAPNKESIYPEYLPDEIRSGGGPTLLDRIVASNTDPELEIIDLRPTLLAAKEGALVYYRTDTHWNPLGAFTAYQEIAGWIGEDFPSVRPYSRDEFRASPELVSGDLSAMLMMKNELIEESVELEPLFIRKALTDETGEGGVLKSKNDNLDLPRAVIFRDSFFNGLKPFLMEHFSEAVVIPSFSVDMEWVAVEEPDVVILEVAERYLPEFLEP